MQSTDDVWIHAVDLLFLLLEAWDADSDKEEIILTTHSDTGFASVQPAATNAASSAVPHTGDAEPASIALRTTNLIVVIAPFLALVFAIIYTWGWGVDWKQLSIAFGMYILTGFGVTIGYHRLFTHKSFATNRVMRAILGVCGSMAVEGPILTWVADHRFHHQHSDQEMDPHSPHLHGHGFFGLLKGLWHSQMGWLFMRRRQSIRHYTRDLENDAVVRTVSRLFPLWVALSLLIPTLLGGLLTWSWWGLLIGFLCGGLARICLVHHITWSVNSVCHVWGARPFQSNDHSRNNMVFGILALGEGWHNNHHAFPRSARHGLLPGQVDFSYLVIRIMEQLGLARDVVVPSPQRMAAKRRDEVVSPSAARDD